MNRMLPPLYRKALLILQSCQNEKQLHTAIKYLELAQMKLKSNRLKAKLDMYLQRKEKEFNN